MFKAFTKVLVGLAALAALALGGSALAAAATSPGAASTTTTQQSEAPAFNGPRPGTAAHENAEKAVTGEAARKAQAAAVKSVGGGTAGAVTTDMTGTGYETTVTTSDGTKVEVHLDSSFAVVHGCPGGPGGQNAPGGQRG